MHYHSKIKIVEMICNHPELSDEKVKAITAIMTQEHNFFKFTLLANLLILFYALSK
jgi:hypothetical protein